MRFAASSSRRSTVRRHLAPLCVLLLGLSGITACADSTEPLAVTTVEVSLPVASLQPGQTTTASVSARDQNGGSIATGPVTWSSSATSIASVDTRGVVTAVAAGTANIIATANGKSGQAAMTVTLPPPVVTTLTVTVPVTTLAFGQTTTATVAAKDQYGAAIASGTASWTSGTPAVATVNATTGVITAVTAGTATMTVTASGKTATATVTVKAPGVVINEVESNGGTPGDWVELYNPTTSAVDISGWGFRDNDTTHVFYRIPAGTSIAPGGYFLVEEAQFGFGLGAADEARLINQYNALVEVYAWTAHATITYGRCPNGTGAFASTSTSTKGAANVCGAPPPPPTPTSAPWPGTDDVRTVDSVNVFMTNGSGLTYEGASGSTPAVLWAVRNNPGTLFRMIKTNGLWKPDVANGWTLGKAIKYLDGTGNPDTEGVTFAAGGSAGGMYVATERNNDASTVSRSVVIRVDPTQAGPTLTATNQWDLTADLPATGANLGIEAITWIPDSMLVANGFYDEAKGRTYAPADYANHGTGLFFVGLEANGSIYGYALNHTNNTFTRVATFASGFTQTTGTSSIMDLAYDRESGYLWGVCDDTCNGSHAVIEIDKTPGSATLGRFRTTRFYGRPSTMPNINNEGFTFAPNAECVANKKPVFWADDNETGGNTIRSASMPCGVIPPVAPTRILRPSVPR